MTDIEREMLIEAYRFAANSPDPSTQNGAIVICDGIGLRDCNRFPDGVEDSADRLGNRDLKLIHMEHAERNVIYQAAKLGIATGGGTMYACWASCTECARAIISAGIRELVAHSHPAQNARPEWAASITAGDIMMIEAGVIVRRVAGVLGMRIRFGGQMIDV